MAIKQKLTGVGTAPAQTQNIVGTMANTLAAAGSTQGTATALGNDDYNIFTTVAASTGAILPSNLSASDEMWVANYGANSLSVYPPTGGKINNGSANAAVAVAAGKNASFICIDGTNFLAAISA
jgi:hypothetical protein